MAGYQTVSKARDMSRETAQISCQQHVQDGVTWCEFRLVIQDEVVGEKERFISTVMMDSMTLLMIGSKLICL